MIAAAAATTAGGVIINVQSTPLLPPFVRSLTAGQALSFGCVGLVVLGQMGFLTERFSTKGTGKGLFSSVGSDVNIHGILVFEAFGANGAVVEGSFLPHRALTLFAPAVSTLFLDDLALISLEREDFVLIILVSLFSQGSWFGLFGSFSPCKKRQKRRLNLPL